MPITERMLVEDGEFYPHAAYMKSNGEIVLVGADDPRTDKPKCS